MDSATNAKLSVGDWCVDAARCEMTRDGATVRLDPRTLRLLLCLTARAGELVSADELLNEVWPGVIVSPDSMYQAIASLRRLLGDDPKQATYIVTVPRQGYRMAATVGPWVEPGNISVPPTPLAPPPSQSSSRKRGALFLAASLPVIAGIAFWMYGMQATKAVPATANVVQAAPIQKSIAVLPFADLTEGMGHEVFADGITEELINRFSKIPGFKVPAPTSSFYYKGKQTAIARIAQELGVNYIVDGSVRKSGGTLRIATRLIKADNGFIIWSENYDKPVNDLLMVQDDIADAVSKALQATIAGGAGAPNPEPTS